MLIWNLVLISLIVWQIHFNWQHSSNFHWDCKIAGRSKLTETLKKKRHPDVVDPKWWPFQPLQEKLVIPNRLFLKNCRFKITIIQSPPKRLIVHVRKMHEDENLNGEIGSTLQLELLDSSALNRLRLCLCMFERSRTESAFYRDKDSHHQKALRD